MIKQSLYDLDICLVWIVVPKKEVKKLKLFSVVVWEIVMGTFYFVLTLCILLIYYSKHNHTQPCMQSTHMKTFTVLISTKERHICS